MLSPLFSAAALGSTPGFGALPTFEPQDEGDAFSKALQRAHEAARPPAAEPAVGETGADDSDASNASASAESAERTADDEDNDDAKAEKSQEPVDLAAWMTQWMGPRAVPSPDGRTAAEDGLQDAKGAKALKALTGRQGLDGADDAGLNADATLAGLDGDAGALLAQPGMPGAAGAARPASERQARGALGRGARGAADAANGAEGLRAAGARAEDTRREEALALAAAVAPSGEGSTEGTGTSSSFAPAAAAAASALAPSAAGFKTLLHGAPAPAGLNTAIAAPLDSPEFAPALGLQVAVMARDGIEQARVQLHPADMGPIELKLALEGTQVRVDLLADLSATRQVLEQALPDLAGALREAGFTLTGGGVFQQSSREGSAPKDTDGWPTRAVGRRAGVAALDSAGESRSVVRARVQRGLVDTFA